MPYYMQPVTRRARSEAHCAAAPQANPQLDSKKQLYADQQSDQLVATLDPTIALRD